MSNDHEQDVIDFLNRVLQLGSFDLNAESEPSEEGLKIQVRGGDVSYLLGRNAELLEALEYLVNRIYAPNSGLDSRIVVDSGSYRAGREKELQLMAVKAAERVRTSRIPFSFDPMTPNERRIVHLALSEDSTVRTESQGGGVDRKVTIFPA